MISKVLPGSIRNLELMMNEEALELIKGTEQCFVIWAQDRNEIVAVNPVGVVSNADDLLPSLRAMSTDYQGPTVAGSSSRRR